MRRWSQAVVSGHRQLRMSGTDAVQLSLYLSVILFRCVDTAPTACLPPTILIHDGPRCCVDITCPPGKQPLKCSLDEPSSTTCEVCPDDTYNPDKAVFGAGDTCILKRKCIGRHMTYAQHGNTVTDAECACQQRYYLSDGQLHCDRNLICPAGKGQNGKGGCVTCPSGWFSDRQDRDQVCQKHTDCLGIGQCVLKHGDSVSDAKCGQWNVEHSMCIDLQSKANESLLTISTVNSSQTLASYTRKPTTGPRGQTHQSHLGIGLGVGIPVLVFLAIVILAIVILAIFCIHKRRTGSMAGNTQDVSGTPCHMIETHRAYLVNHLDPQSVIDELVQHGVVSDEDNQRVSSHVTRQEKVREILTIVKREGEKGYSYFLDALQSGAPSIADEICGTNEYQNVSNRRNRVSGQDRIADRDQTIPLRPVNTRDQGPIADWIPDRKT